MLCRQCEETLAGTGCTRNGVCGKTAEIAEKQDLLIGTLIELASGDKVCEICDCALVDGLFMTLSNTNFDGAAIDALRNEVLGKIGADTVIRVKDIESLDADPDLRSLKELLLFGLKGLAAYYHHAAVLGYTDPNVTAFIRKGLASLAENLSADELVALNMECGSVGAACLALLDKANTETYGTPELSTVKTGVGTRPGILITGHDLKDLEQLLEQTEGTGVDVYTHGEMLPANAYPAFKKYGNLAGNYGGPAPKEIDNVSLTVGFGHSQVLALADKIIEAVKSGAIKRFVVMAGCDGREKGRTYYREFAEALPKDTVILTAGCAKYRYNKLNLGDIGGIPRVIDAGQCNDCYSLVVIANALAEAFGTDVNGLPLSFNISWYEQKAVLVLLTLLSLGVKDIMLGPRLPGFITPGILKVLVDTFGLKPNTSVREDMVTLKIE